MCKPSKTEFSQYQKLYVEILHKKSWMKAAISISRSSNNPYCSAFDAISTIHRKFVSGSTLKKF